MLARRPGRGVLVVLVLAALGQVPLARADSGNVALNLDRYDGTEAIRGWAAGAMWMGRAGDQDPFRVGLAGVWLEDGHWGYAAAGRTFHLGQRNQCDASARWGRASLPGQSHDFTEVSATLYTSVVPGRWIVTLGDSWLDVGDREGQLVQGGLDFVARGRWSAGLRLFSGITGDLEENYLNGNVRLRGASVTWVLGATVGRTVPFPGAAPEATQSSSEVYLGVAIPVGRQQMTFTASRFDGESTTRRTLSASWLLPLSPQRGTAPEGAPP